MRLKPGTSWLAGMLVLFLCVGAAYHLAVAAYEKAKLECAKRGGELIVTRQGDVCLRADVVLKSGAVR